MSSVEGLKEEVYQRLSRDLTSCDFLLGVFWAALSSYRHDTVLRPFPPNFVLAEGSKDVEALRSSFEQLPPVTLIQEKLANLGSQLLQLLHWALHSKLFVLHSRPTSMILCDPPSQFSKIREETIGSTHCPTPKHILELVYNKESEEQFQYRAKEHGTFLAYHGSRVENFHSIVHNGLLSHMNKTGVFGEGTYLSTDLAVCMNFSPTGQAWGGSNLPSLCSMVAVCQVINHPGIRSRVQVGGEPSINQKIPDRYFVVTNDELLRVKYVLVFSHRRAMPRFNQGWLFRHVWVVCVMIYVLVLVILGLSQSRYLTQMINWRTHEKLSL